MRVDAELVRRGLARSRAHAGELVKAGRVSVRGLQVTKPSSAIGDDAEIDVVADPLDEGYASRAALKLAGALDAFAASGPGDHLEVGAGATGQQVADAVPGAWCLDLGASTGGFTDVLLRRGAAHVVALDVGHDQLVPRLRDDSRVTAVEGYNVRDLDRADLERSPDLVVGDLSFISLTLVLPPLARVLGPGTPALLMVKPQFEVGKDRLGTGGVVRDPALHVSAVLDVVAAGADVGLLVRAVVPSPLPGPSGNREYFVAFERGEPLVGEVAREASRPAVTAAVAWQPDDAGSVRPPVFTVGTPVAPPIAAVGAAPVGSASSAGAATDPTNPSSRTGGAP
ncbi:TlyA family RNA methyltransferase [Xylanimonas protaetiae]|uniref:TlyA family RNA methyltransferase n=1 Tax=Xylanimonas protaetiae TaxID=2509457 RepID=UPI001F5D210D|nr:TlyA family RNA methyltransferase [Xylanimonas protaetiae]